MSSKNGYKTSFFGNLKADNLEASGGIVQTTSDIGTGDIRWRMAVDASGNMLFQYSTDAGANWVSKIKFTPSPGIDVISA